MPDADNYDDEVITTTGCCVDVVSYVFVCTFFFSFMFVPRFVL